MDYLVLALCGIGLGIAIAALIIWHWVKYQFSGIK